MGLFRHSIKIARTLRALDLAPDPGVAFCPSTFPSLISRTEHAGLFPWPGEPTDDHVWWWPNMLLWINPDHVVTVRLSCFHVVIDNLVAVCVWKTLMPDTQPVVGSLWVSLKIRIFDLSVLVFPNNLENLNARLLIFSS